MPVADSSLVTRLITHDGLSDAVWNVPEFRHSVFTPAYYVGGLVPAGIETLTMFARATPPTSLWLTRLIYDAHP